MVRCRIARVAGLLWIAAASGLWLVGIAGAFAANGFWGGVQQIQVWMSPFNIISWLVIVVVFGPGLALLSWAHSMKPEPPGG